MLIFKDETYINPSETRDLDRSTLIQTTFETDNLETIKLLNSRISKIKINDEWLSLCYDLPAVKINLIIRSRSLFSQ